MIEGEKQEEEIEDLSKQPITAELNGGKLVKFTYKKRLIQICLAEKTSGEIVLEAGEAEDLGFSPEDLGFPKWRDGSNFYIIERDEFTQTDGRNGWKHLALREQIQIGRATRPNNFKFNDYISRFHILIARDGPEILIKDLNSLHGTKVTF